MIAIGHMEVLFFLCALNIAGRYLRKQYPFTLIIRDLISCFSFWNTYLKLSSCVVMFLILSGYSLSLTSFTHTLFFFCARTFLILKKIYGGLFEAVHKLFDEISQNIGKLKKIFMKAHYFKLQFFGQPMCENCLTVKRDSYWVFWT